MKACKVELLNTRHQSSPIDSIKYELRHMKHGSMGMGPCVLSKHKK